MKQSFKIPEIGRGAYKAEPCAPLSFAEQHRLLVERSSDILSHADRSGHLVFVSPAIERVLGITPSQAAGKRFADYIHPDDIGQFVGLLRQWRRAPEPQTLQCRALAASGEAVWLECVVSPIYDAAHRLTGTVATSRDIGERRRADTELRLAHERSEIASRAKSRFLANMSHELRTPLNAIIGFSEILSREMFGPIGMPRYKEYSDLILESGRLLLDLINDLLDMAKIEAGRYVVTPDTLDLQELLTATMRLVQRQVEGKGLHIAIDVPPLTSPVVADQRAIKQIVLNLLSNAIKFTPSGGNIRIGASEQATHVTISVSDNGIGIPESALGRLAVPFEQAHGDLMIAKGGTGLGLALVRSLARLHGGDIEIKSREGEGTTVFVHLPREGAKVPAHKQST